MLYQKKEFKMNIGGKEIILETGRLAKQADGAVLVTCGGTQVLVSACSDTKMKEGQDFFPLTVDYTEKFYAAGKFLGGFMKRESRPTLQETLNARLIDRPLRPLFPEGYFYDTFIQATVFSYDPENDPEYLAGIGASAALCISDIPFMGPIGMCKVGRFEGKLMLNPPYAKWHESDMEIAIAASKDAILMVEGEAKEISEQDFMDAMNFAHDNIRKMCDCIIEMQKAVGKAKRVYTPATPNKTLMDKVSADFGADARAALSIGPKLERQNAVKALTNKVTAALKANPAQYGLEEKSSFDKQAFSAVDAVLYTMMRNDILDNENRIGGRKLTQVRPIESEVSVLRQPHGSSLFTRGETQVMATVTIGGADGEQMMDRIVGTEYSKFYLHYNFPPFSVGEARGSRGPGRREFGHGNLAERALKYIVPNEFPYTTRVVCEVLESNGSSSMASVCSGCMALMDAGVPVKTPVAGIAMGLISDGKRFKILTDILGDEDHLGDMDFKVAGSTKGITAIQMDIKITGITNEIVEKALAQAKEGRIHILGEMLKTLPAPRSEYRPGVPRIETIKINPEKIGMLIGPGGKNIKGLQEEFQVTIECNDDGTIRILGQDVEKIRTCLTTVDMQLNGPTVGKDYEAVVVTIKEYGCFVDIAPGVSGLVHVSEIADERITDVNEYVREGDKVMVRVTEVDKLGRYKFSIKAVKPLAKKAK